MVNSAGIWVIAALAVLLWALSFSSLRRSRRDAETPDPDGAVPGA